MRTEFAQYYRTKIEIYSKFLKRTIFLDECKISQPGKVNKQNCRICGSERHQQVNKTSYKSFSVMIWCVFLQKEIIKPFFKNENITGQSCKRFLRYHVIPLLPRLSGRYDISTAWCSSLLCHCCKAVLTKNASKPLDRDIKHDSLTSTFARLNYL